MSDDPKRLYQACRSVKDDEGTRANVIAALERSLKLFRDLPDEPKGEAHARALGEAATLLDNILRKFPPVWCWCVVKHYDSPRWRPAVWSAHFTEERAEAFAEATRKRFPRDRFEVEWKRSHLVKIINPEFTVEDYESER